MDSQKLLTALPDIAIEPWPLNAAFVPDDREWHYNRGSGEPGSPEKLRQSLYVKPDTDVI